jgi:hypothetical protein
LAHRADAPADYPEAFERAWQVYPKRSGTNSKREAYQAFNARCKEGVSPEDMLAGLQRYLGHLSASGKLGSEYVMQARRFFGPGKPYAEPWEPPPNRSPQTLRNIDAAREFVRQGEEADATQRP